MMEIDNYSLICPNKQFISFSYTTKHKKDL